MGNHPDMYEYDLLYATFWRKMKLHNANTSPTRRDGPFEPLSYLARNGKRRKRIQLYDTYQGSCHHGEGESATNIGYIEPPRDQSDHLAVLFVVYLMNVL